MKYTANIKLRHKLFLLLLFCLLAMFGLSLLLNQVIIHHYHDMLVEQVHENLRLSSNSITDMIQATEEKAALLAADPKLQSYLRRRSENTHTAAEYSQMYQLIANTYFTHTNTDHMKYINIIGEDFAIGTYTSTAAAKDPDIRSQLITEAEKSQGACRFYADNSTVSQVLCIKTIREIEHLSLNTLGTLVIGIDLDSLLKPDSPDHPEQMVQVLTDRSHSLIYQSASVPAILPEQLQMFSSPSSSIVLLDGAKYLKTTVYMKEPQWYYTALVPYDDIASTQTLYLVMTVLVSGFCLLLLFLFSTSLIKRIFTHFDRLIIGMKEGKVEFNVSHSQGGDLLLRTDEVGDLYRQFGRMADQINQLIYDNYEMQLKSKEYRIKALSAQISPHFLYNTLDTINWRAKASNVAHISEMVESLGRILKRTLSNSSYFFTLEDELEIVQNYMNIQSLRYGDTLTFHSAVDEELRLCLVPRLILQPLIENAIQESMSYIDGFCYLHLTVSSSSGQMLIQVANSGSCFEDDFAELFTSDGIKHHGFGIGLKNIEERLSLCYEADFSIRFYNNKNQAVVDILIPLQYKQEESYD